MRKLLRRTAAVLAALALLSAPVAAADELGGLLITPGESADVATIQLRTAAGCPAKADAYYAKAAGHGMPRAGQIIAPNSDAGLSHDGPFVVHVAQTLKDFAADNNTTLRGRYVLTVYCIDSFTQRSYGEFTGALRFTSPKRYEAIGAAKGPKRLPNPDARPPERAGQGAPQGKPGQRPAVPAEDAPAPAAHQQSGAPGSTDDSPTFLLIAAGAVGVAALGFVLGRVGRGRPTELED